MHVVVVRSVDEVVLQVDQIGKVEEANEVMDEEVLHVEVRLMSSWMRQ